MTSGMNIASTTARSISPSKCCIAVAVSISPRERARRASRARFLIICPKPISVYGSSSASMPPNFCTSSVCSRTIASITSSTVTMPRTCSALVDDRHGEQVVLGDDARDLLAVGARRDRHRRAAGADVRARVSEPSATIKSRSDTTCDEAVLVVEDIDDVDRLLLHAPTSRCSRAVCATVQSAGTRHELGGHDAAGGLRPVLEQQLERVPRVADRACRAAAPSRARAARARGPPAGPPTSPRSSAAAALGSID